eukprot:1146555-Pelagomonas_calceolata.AAC.1
MAAKPLRWPHTPATRASLARMSTTLARTMARLMSWLIGTSSSATTRPAAKAHRTYKDGRSKHASQACKQASKRTSQRANKNVSLTRAPHQKL